MRVVARAELPTRFGRFTIAGIEGRGADDEAAAIIHGDVSGAKAAFRRGQLNGGKTTLAHKGVGHGKAPLVRIHSQCLTGDVFTSERCDCRAQLEFSLKKIAKEPSGVVLYLPQEGRGIGLDEQAEGLRVAGWRPGYGGGQSAAWDSRTIRAITNSRRRR